MYSEVANMRERRKNFRVEWNSTAKIYDLDGRFYGLCIVSNFSNGGAKITSIKPSAVPDKFFLHIAPRIRPQTCKVVRRTKEGLGVIFIDNAKGASDSKVDQRRKFIQRSERQRQLA